MASVLQLHGLLPVPLPTSTESMWPFPILWRQLSCLFLRSATEFRSQELRKPFHRAMVLCLGLLSVFLLGSSASASTVNRGTIHDSMAELFMTKANLTERLQASNDKLSSISEERDLLKANLTEMAKELDRLQSLSKQKKTCPSQWIMFRCSCYFFSTVSDSWGKGRQDCRDTGADLVMIDSYEEQVM
ncbi:C-type lectin domain family 4 member C Blood dendritic cell antigen 2 [Larimichthys crocea]|uniref:C-type lectin domain family 4 member C Blood dendritic cell antigen 2 n=1 Tax=Larimichthys crocea TaxID=215358 RepID=A0A6G0J840_LARCR|nr:C-type lectin domain family 4 member C Blood dendritic cell antigen 2 [Larimichthys crocea]